MSDTAVLLLALGIFVVVVAFIAGVALFIFRYHRQPVPRPSVTAGPNGPVAQIPTRQISVVSSGMPWLSLVRYSVRGTLTIGPGGLEYTRFLRGPKRLPYAEVSHAQMPVPSRPTLLTIHLRNGWGLVAITGSHEGRELALTELSRWVPVAPGGGP